MLKAQEKNPDNDCIVWVHGVCLGKLPQSVVELFGWSDFVNPTGIVLSFEGLKMYIYFFRLTHLSEII